MSSRVALVVLAAVVASCHVDVAFTCERDEQCQFGDAIGLCEHDGFCTFEDSSCESGFRYDERAADEVASTCAVACPLSYNVTLLSSRTRYRIITTVEQYWVQHPACIADLPGVTHLANVETLQESVELAAFLRTIPGSNNDYCVGGVQDPQALTPDAGWIDFRGNPVPPELWLVDQPSDSNDSETDHDQNILYLSRAEIGLRDLNGNGNERAICECDRHPVSELAQSFLDLDRNNPN